MLTLNQIESFKKNGYLVIENYIDQRQRNLLMNRAEELIDEFEPPSSRSVFTTNEQERTSDEYFLSSGDKIRFFFEEKAIDEDGNFTVPKQQSINKIGHAQHILDPVYKEVIKELNFPEGQGFTINHISGWYLNFSYFGIPIGGGILALIIIGAFLKQSLAKTGVKELIWLIILCSITAFSAMLVRGGPEAFKPMIIEAIIIPIIILG